MYGDRSSWSGSWTLSFDNNEDHSCKPASHCLLRESTPINTKDSNSLPKPPDFAWPQSQQSSTSRLVTPPIVRWSRTKPTQLSPAIKKALSYHGSTQKGEQYRYGSICTTSTFFCMSCLSQAVTIMALQTARSFVTVMLCYVHATLISYLLFLFSRASPFFFNLKPCSHFLFLMIIAYECQLINVVT